MTTTRLLTLGLICLGAPIWADCATDAEIEAYVADYLANTPTKALVPDGSMDDALCTQDKLVTALTAHLGSVVGYKAGLTSKPAQERFGVSEPVQGVLLRDMLLQDGAEVPMAWGARPVFEADLLLVIGSGAINDATTAQEAMPFISAVRPFIELPDLAVAEGEPINGITLTANAVAPKLGVMGAEIPVQDPDAMYAALGAMTVTLSAADGEVLAEVPGEAVLGHPVNSAIWLMSKGIILKPGDLVSVGSFGPLVPPAKGKGGATARYTGLPGDPTVSVTFK